MDQEIDLNKDWKFLSIIQFANVFKNVLGIETISTYEMSFSLKNPEIEPLCLNVLLKLIMKKTLFKANSKIGENYEVGKLNEILIKKINYLYKTYLRYLKKAYSLSEPNQIFEIIKQDTEMYNNKNDSFKMTSSNLMDKVYDDLDLKTLMVINFFREVGGFNPLQKVFTKEKMEQLLNQEGKEKEIVEMTTAAVNNPNTNDIIIEDYLGFAELDLRKKIDFLYFFCNYAITFSGRAPFFKEELTKTTDDAIRENKKIVPVGYDIDGYSYYTFPLNKECKIFKETMFNEFELCVKDYSELEKLIENESQYLFINKIRDKLLQYKENDEEEYKKEQALLRKQEAFEKAKKLSSFHANEVGKYPNNDYILMNISNHVITRNQLNQITKNNTNNLNVNNTKVHELTEDEKHRQKIEKDNLDRELRMEKRNKRQEKMKMKIKMQETHRNQSYHGRQILNRMNPNSSNFTNKKRKRPKRRSSSSEEEYGDSSEKNSSYANDEDIKLESDTEKEADNNNNNNNTNTNNNCNYNENHSNNNYDDSNKQNDNYIYNNNISLTHKEDDDNNNNDYSLYDNNYHEGMRNNEEDSSNDIINEGYLIYRYSNNQIELEGNWYVTNDPFAKERVSYLYTNSNKTKDYVVSKDNVTIDNEEIKLKMCKYAINQSMTIPSICDYRMKICSANLFECITINQLGVFESCLDYLCGEYAGYFMYYGKTIEDHFKLNYLIEDSLVSISGEGMNNLGSFSINGYMNFYKSKEILIEKNKIDDLFIKIAEFKMTKRYIDFNPTENDRVIKSYNHRRKKNDSDLDY